jgi:hypothetical protein
MRSRLVGTGHHVIELDDDVTPMPRRRELIARFAAHSCV